MNSLGNLMNIKNYLKKRSNVLTINTNKKNSKNISLIVRKMKSIVV